MDYETRTRVYKRYYALILVRIHTLQCCPELTEPLDDLNPLYVYESKMSFLIRLGESRHGAERLLECRVLPILSQMDFLDSRPEPDENTAGERILFLNELYSWPLRRTR